MRTIIRARLQVNNTRQLHIRRRRGLTPIHIGLKARSSTSSRQGRRNRTTDNFQTSKFTSLSRVTIGTGNKAINQVETYSGNRPNKGRTNRNRRRHMNRPRASFRPRLNPSRKLRTRLTMPRRVNSRSKRTRRRASSSNRNRRRTSRGLTTATNS